MGIKTFGAFIIGGVTALSGKALYENVLKKNGLDVKVKEAFCNWIHKKKDNPNKEELIDNCNI